MAGVASGVCAPWAVAGEDCVPCDAADFPAGVLDDALAAASNLLYLKSGRQFPGECEIEVRPTPVCRDQSGRSSQRVEGVGWHTWGDWWAGCGCGNGDACRCGGFAQLGLGVGPIVSIGEVVIDGAILDPTLYRVDDWKYLTRLPDADGTNPGWPCCSDLSLPDGAVGTWSVELTYGKVPPIEGRMAAAVYGCELAKACAGSADCQLPRRVTNIVRQGVSMTLLDPMTFLTDGLTGLGGIVDDFIVTHNPGRRRGRARLIGPGAPAHVRAGT